MTGCGICGSHGQLAAGGEHGVELDELLEESLALVESSCRSRPSDSEKSERLVVNHVVVDVAPGHVRRENGAEKSFV